MKQFLFTLCLICVGFYGNSQFYDDYIGAGHADGVTVTTSSSSFTTDGSSTINGNGLDAELMEASRFLNQATMGANRALIEDMVSYNGDYEAWIDQQISQTSTLMTPTVESIWDEIVQGYAAIGVGEDELFGPWAVHFNYAWWQINLTNDDLLRQKMAYALSQVLVISANSDLRDRATSMTNFYDIFVNNAFGNFKDILMEVTLHPSMGYYLSHLNNPREIPEENIHPDENYAREIMQLFSIGLYELNIDGSRKLDGSGNPIPTYDNDDIKELAKVFTGLGPGAINSNVDWTDEPYFGLGIYGTDMTVPMVMYDFWHDAGEKVLLGTHTIPAGQDGMIDIEEAVDFLFNHENVGPFISRLLIQRFVKSNPSGDYITRVANTFNDNGQGVRGDLEAVIKAILLDQEARECSYLQDPTNGRLREPLMRFTQLCRAIPIDSPLDRYWNSSYGFLDRAKQIALHAPSVFNFYLPDNQPVGGLADAGLVGPEYKIHDTASSVGFINEMNSKIIWNGLMYSWEDEAVDPHNPTLDTEDLELLSQEDIESMLNELDILFSHGQLTDETRQIIRTAVDPMIQNGSNDDIYYATRLALYLLVISPDYSILK